MKPVKRKFSDGVNPRQQQHWDWRAATNFIAGGTGGGLMAMAALASLAGADVRALLVAGMVLIGVGLTSVWFEIGRPWRALNVYRHLATSWMTREAAVAPFVFAFGALAVVTAHPGAVLLAALAGAVFVYSQARILSADKGIPAWRHPRCLPLLLGTGFAEGAGFVALASPLLLPGAPAQIGVAAVLLLWLLVRMLLWRSYLGGLRATGAPAGSLRALGAVDRRFGVVGHLIPALLALVAVLIGPAAAPALAVAGVLVVGSGWLVKYTLVRRAAFTQGFALPHLPVRGRGPAGAAVKPGWSGAR